LVILLFQAKLNAIGDGSSRYVSGRTEEPSATLWTDSYDLQSDADRAAHKAMPVQVALTLAGSVESIVITVNVQV